MKTNRGLDFLLANSGSAIWTSKFFGMSDHANVSAGATAIRRNKRAMAL